MHDALTEAKTSHRPIELLIANDDFYSTVSVAVYTGNRYPHLERDTSKPDMLSKIYAPRTFAPKDTDEDQVTPSVPCGPPLPDGLAGRGRGDRSRR